MSFPSEPNAIRNGWIAKMCKPFTEWCKRRQCIPNPNDFMVSESPDGIRFSLAEKFSETIAALSAHRLQVLDATDGATVQYRVRLGKIAGVIADPGMNDPGDDPPFLKTMSSPADGWYVVYCKLAMNYSGEGNWSPDPGDIFTGTADADLPDNDDDWFYVEISQIRCESGGIVEITPAPAAKNDIAIGRSGNEDTYRDTTVQVLAS